MSVEPPAAGPASPGQGDSPPASESAFRTAAEAGPAAPARRRSGPVAAIALVLALAAAAVAAGAWWQQHERGAALAAANEALEGQVEALRQARGETNEHVAALEAAVAAERQRSADLAERLSDLPARFADLERRLDPLPERLADVGSRLEALQGGATAARDEWLRAEAEYYLRVANTELQLAGRWENAATALRLADERLGTLGDPSLTAVRERIADELLALGSVEPPDLDGVVLTLGRLAERVADLPLRDGVPTRYEALDAPTATEPGLSRLWASVRNALGGIFRVERSDERPPPLSDERRALARRELALELRLARVAALRGQGDAFASSLGAATALLERDFDVDHAAVSHALRVLDGIRAVDVAPARPDISGSLGLLRQLRSGTG